MKQRCLVFLFLIFRVCIYSQDSKSEFTASKEYEEKLLTRKTEILDKKYSSITQPIAINDYAAYTDNLYINYCNVSNKVIEKTVFNIVVYDNYNNDKRITLSKTCEHKRKQLPFEIVEEFWDHSQEIFSNNMEIVKISVTYEDGTTDVINREKIQDCMASFDLVLTSNNNFYAVISYNQSGASYCLTITTPFEFKYLKCWFETDKMELSDGEIIQDLVEPSSGYYNISNVGDKWKFRIDMPNYKARLLTTTKKLSFEYLELNDDTISLSDEEAQKDSCKIEIDDTEIIRDIRDLACQMEILGLK